MVAAKQSGIQGLAVRVLAGENFAQLAGEASEDEANKTRGGDLGYFSSARLPEDFMAESGKLHGGEVSAPFRSALGFHIVQLTDTKPARMMSFAEAQREIALVLQNARRAASVTQFKEQLGSGATVVRP